MDRLHTLTAGVFQLPVEDLPGQPDEDGDIATSHPITWTGHSPRIGLASTGRQKGKDTIAIADQGG
ncbi:hypothetical protein ADK90_38350 [Streptomyces sp. XY413]|uniref:hypothetical protein n=1 Tax=Streptomyces sp. XY413 TaxID=1519479 RepID=UPI0006ADB1E7|nr:hypothetical protein [Streptomyces sp. XY413]KOV13291.1 hypothetical protein ADK90_38350 [Streptomyces sp. XY413]